MSDRHPYEKKLISAVAPDEVWETLKKWQEQGWVKDLGSIVSVTEASKALGFSIGYLKSVEKLAREGKSYEKEWGGAAAKGTDVHSILEDLATFGLPGNDNTWAGKGGDRQEREEDWLERWGELKGFAEGALKWWKHYRPKPIEQEFLVYACYHRQGFISDFAGRADLYALVKPNKRVLIDYKTVGKPEHLTNYPRAFRTNRQELVARAVAMIQEGRPVDECWVVRFCSDGQFDTHVIGKERFDGLYEAFLRTLDEHRFQATEEGTDYVPVRR